MISLSVLNRCNSISSKTISKSSINSSRSNREATVSEVNMIKEPKGISNLASVYRERERGNLSRFQSSQRLTFFGSGMSTFLYFNVIFHLFFEMEATATDSIILCVSLSLLHLLIDFLIEIANATVFQPPCDATISHYFYFLNIFFHVYLL